MSHVGPSELTAAYEGLIKEIRSLPDVVPDGNLDVAGMLSHFDAIRSKMSEVQRLLPGGIDPGYMLGKCAVCGGEQYQFLDGERATDSYGRTFQGNLFGVGGCTCSWP